MTASLSRRALGEFIGTAFLVMAVIGSGIAASRLSPGDVGLELFENAVVTGAALVADNRWHVAMWTGLGEHALLPAGIFSTSVQLRARGRDR